VNDQLRVAMLAYVMCENAAKGLKSILPIRFDIYSLRDNVKTILILIFLIALPATAQVKVCVDSKGKKTFTDYECPKLGLNDGQVIHDINITPKQCAGIQDSITNSRNSLARHDATPSNRLNPAMPMFRNALVTQLESQQMRNAKECVR